MAVSQREQEFIRRIGTYKGDSHAAAAAEHRALPLEERLQRSWQLYLSSRDYAANVDDDPSPFYDRARALGLYRP